MMQIVLNNYSLYLVKSPPHQRMSLNFMLHKLFAQEALFDKLYFCAS
jgi:hypothetical protein